MVKSGGRPRALDEAKWREICALVSAGASVKRAAQYVGCSPRTIQREAQRNEEFRKKLQRAQATTQLAPLQAMRQAAQSDWRAAAWMLERADPDQFGRSRPYSMGPKELRRLARDLMAIFNDAISNPMIQEQVAEQVRATINYAMRHAWDTQRSGNTLREAMEYFTKKDTARDCWHGMIEFPLSDFHDSNDPPADQLGFDAGGQS